MATANPTRPDHGEDNFVLELWGVREQINQKFGELIDCVKAREYKLLKELDAIIASYHSYRDEVQKQKERIELEMLQPFLQSELKLSISEGLCNQVTVGIGTIDVPPEPKMVHFVCDHNIIFAELNKLGKLVEKIESTIDYKSKVHPVVSVCEKGNGMKQLYNPWGMTVDNKTGNIYIADWGNTHCVKVFDSSGKILFKFGDRDGEGKMFYPKGLVIIEDRILISNKDNLSLMSSHNILIYQLNGNMVSKIGKCGKGKIEFNDLCGLGVNELNGEIYICDCYDNRIQILSKELQFQSQFGADRLKHPRDVKLSKESIFILDESNPCIHLYDYNLILRKSVVSRGKGMQIVHSNCFFVDNYNNIFISDYCSRSINIFNSEFELIHKISTSTHPMGVAVDNKGRIMVVCQANKGCFQIF